MLPNDIVRKSWRKTDYDYFEDDGELGDGFLEPSNSI